MTEARAKEILSEVKIEESADARPRACRHRLASGAAGPGGLEVELQGDACRPTRASR